MFCCRTQWIYLHTVFCTPSFQPSSAQLDWQLPGTQWIYLCTVSWTQTEARNANTNRGGQDTRHSLLVTHCTYDCYLSKFTATPFGILLRATRVIIRTKFLMIWTFYTEWRSKFKIGVVGVDLLCIIHVQHIAREWLLIHPVDVIPVMFLNLLWRAGTDRFHRGIKCDATMSLLITIWTSGTTVYTILTTCSLCGKLSQSNIMGNWLRVLIWSQKK